MGWTVAPGEPAELFHYSEDASIDAFTPHVPATNPSQRAAVWAIDAERAPLYWFPRDCPRVTVWANDDEQQRALSACFMITARRVHAAPNGMLDQIRACALWEYVFDPAPFVPWPEAEGQWVAYETVHPLEVRPVGDLLAHHAEAGVELRFVPNLAVLRAAVVESGLPFSVVRFRASG